MSLELVHPYLVHPRTGEPLRAVGIVAGKPVWPVMGGDGSEGDANDNGDTGNDGDQDGDLDLGGDNSQDGDQDGDGSQDGDEDARVKRANRQAAQYRTQLRETQQELQAIKDAQEQSTGVLEALRKALGGDAGEGDENADPAEQVQTLTGEVENLRTDLQDAQRQLLVFELALDPAEAIGANPVALLDSRRFMDSLRRLDAGADDYRAQVAEAIRTAVESNANLRAGQGSRRGGAEDAGRSKDGTVSLESFQAMSAQQRSELRASNPTLYRKLADEDVASRKRR